MAISATAMSPTQFGGYSAGQPGMPQGQQSLFSSLALNPVGGQGASSSMLSQMGSNPQASQIYSLLGQAPQSLTSTLMPLLQQVYGMQGNLMQPLFAQQGQQGAAQAQSDAMSRGLTGSSIEGANMQQAYNQSNQGFSQYLAQQLSSLIPTYAGAAGSDISNQQNYQSQLAQAIGQQMASQIQQSQFTQQLNASQAEAAKLANAQQNAGIAGGLGSIFGGLFSGAGAAGGFGNLFSDVRLKHTVTPLGRWRGLTLYLFGYRQDKGLDLPRGARVGFLAHEVARSRPDCVRLKQGYLQVNYGRLFGVPAHA